MKFREFIKTFHFRMTASFLIIVFFAAISMIATVEFSLVPSMQSKIKQELTNSTRALAGSISANAHALIRNNLKSIAQQNVEIAKHHLSMIDQGLLSKEEAVRRLKAILLSQKVGRSGYIYCIDHTGTVLLHPNREVENTNISQYAFVQKQLKLKTGYLEYEWKNPGEEFPRPKALYMEYFEPLDWIISVSSYRSEFYQLLAPEDFRETVNSLHFGNSGYAYVFNTEGKILIHPFLSYLTNIFEENHSASEHLKTMRVNDSGMIEYSWKNPNEQDSRKKIAVYERLPEYGWIVASSAYIDEVMAPAIIIQKSGYISGFIIFIVTAIVSLILSIRLNKPIKAMLLQLNANRKNGTNQDLPVLNNDEFGQLAMAFNSFTKEIEINSKILQRERKQYETFFETSPDAIFLFRGPTIIECNSQACNLFSCEKEELIGCTIEDLSPLEQPGGKTTDILSENLANLSPEDEMQTFEWLHKTKAGRFFIGEVQLKTFGLEDGELLLVGFLRDITEQKRIEEALLLTQFSFDQAAIGILRVGSDGQLITINEQARMDLGYAKSDVNDLTLFDINPTINYEEWPELWEKLRVSKVLNFESVHLRKDGSEFPVEAAIKLLEYKENEYSLAFVQDISERKNNERLRAKMQASLEQSQRLDSLGVLAGGIAHDFNNILSAINGFTELTQIICADNQKAQHFLNQVGSASKRAKNLVEQILNFSRQSGVEKQPVDISKIIYEAIGLIRATVPTTIEITKIIPVNLGTVIANETQIHQIVMNLCTNAFQAIPNEIGSIDVELSKISISAKDEMHYPDLDPGDYLKLSISDSGSGIPQEILQTIFDPYFTTKKPGEGTGLGLSTVHGIVKDHGGDIKVYSELNVGSCFQILFPLVESKEKNVDENNWDLPRGTETILFVDDEKLLLEIGKELLENLGYNVETRASSIDALEAFKVQPDKYDLLVSDLTMPQITGEHLAVEVKKIAPNLPIILCSGFSTRLNAAKLLKLGIAKVLMKPVTVKDFATSIRFALDQQ